MNNKEFIAKLAQKNGMTIAETSTNVDALTAVITEHLKDGDILNISGFGVFEAKMRRERISVNPKSGQRMLIPPKIVPSFRPSVKLKDKFKGAE